MFSEKLNYIMMLTRTTNTELAKFLNLNQSLISRFRQGSRIPPTKSNYVRDIANYLSNKIKKEKLMDKILVLHFDEDTPLSDSIYNWLSSDSELQTSLYSDLNDDMYYYGDVGKRDVSLKFLEENITKKSRTILLYSDENISWMLDENYKKRWKEYLITLLNQGTKIKIIHSLSRNYDELLNAVTMWLPLYLSGNIDAYYIPKLRDGINRKTLFISSNCAVVSTSVEDKTDDMLNIYIKNEKAIKSLKLEFNNYLSLAVPLLKREKLTNFNSKNYKKYTKKANGINITIYLKPLEELIIQLPNSKTLLVSKETNILKAFEQYVSNKNRRLV